MNKENKTKLQELYLKDFKEKYPNVPDHCIPMQKFNDTTANGLTKTIINFIQYIGGQAERISSMGRMIDNRKVSTDVLGRERIIGSLTYIKGTSTNGTADISSIINGKSVKIEIKIGKDRQSEAQKKYQQATEKAGGIYLITTNFDEFMEQYKKLRAGTKLYNGFEIPETTIIHTSMEKRPFRIVCTVSSKIQFLDTGEFHYITTNQMKHYL